MSELKEMEARFEAALARVTTVLSQASNSSEPALASDQRIKTLEAENAQLLSDLEALKADRAKDLAELDQLIAQLKPLLDEVA